MIYMGSYSPMIFEQVMNFKEIEVVGMIIDNSLPSEEVFEIRQKLSDIGVKENFFEDIEKINPDLIFLCGYNKLLRTDLLDKFIFVNVHAGILPKWRGFNSNCWAI